jgi:hypothetical protein
MWEFYTKSGEWLTSHELNKLGNEGWDLISHAIVRDGFITDHYYTFKRQKI